MDPKLIFSIISALIGSAAFYPYIRDILLKKTEPHLYTWLIWFITAGISAAGAWHGGGGYGAINMFLGTMFVGVITLLCLRYGSKNITFADTAVLILALGSIGLWWQFDSPLLAVITATVIDLLGYIPTYRKVYEEPFSETIISWVGFATAPLFALLALTEYNALTTTYLSAIVVANILVVALCVFRRRAK